MVALIPDCSLCQVYMTGHWWAVGTSPPEARRVVKLPGCWEEKETGKRTGQGTGVGGGLRDTETMYEVSQWNPLLCRCYLETTTKPLAPLGLELCLLGVKTLGSAHQLVQPNNWKLCSFCVDSEAKDLCLAWEVRSAAAMMCCSNCREGGGDGSVDFSF